MLGLFIESDCFHTYVQCWECEITAIILEYQKGTYIKE